MEPAENRDDTTHHYPLYRVSIAWLPCHSTPPRQHARPVVGHLPGAARRLGLPGPVQCLLLAHRVDSLRCEGSDAIGPKRTCRERRERVDLTKMTHLRHWLCTAPMVAVHCTNGFQPPVKLVSQRIQLLAPELGVPICGDASSSCC